MSEPTTQAGKALVDDLENEGWWDGGHGFVSASTVIAAIEAEASALDPERVAAALRTMYTQSHGESEAAARELIRLVTR